MGMLSFGNLLVSLSSHRPWRLSEQLAIKYREYYLEVSFIKLAPNVFCVSEGNFGCKEQNLLKLAKMKLSGMKYRMYKWSYNISVRVPWVPPLSLLLSAHLLSSSLQVNFLWEEVLLSHKFYLHMALLHLASIQHDFSDPGPSMTWSIFVFNRLIFQ